jgi:ribose/xylose/arabinose/galactoside ABC-type transport system permease subunit
MSEGKATKTKQLQYITRTDILEFVMKGRVFFALIIVIAVFTLVSPGFLNIANIIIMSKHVAIFAILGIGMTFVMIAGGIDLSVGSIVGLSAMIAGGLINEGIRLNQFGVIVFPHTWMVIVVTMIVGILIGVINGLVITRFKVAPFIATLGMLYIARGFAGLRNNGYTFSNLIGKPEFGNKGFERLGAGNFLGISYSIWIMMVFALVAFFVTTRLPFGRHVFALGGNRRAAELSGVRTNRTETIVYMISGFCSAVVGLIIASQLVAAHPATGTGFELTAIAAVVLGGTSLSGGRGSIGGTIIGAFVIGVLSDGLVILGFSTFLQNIIKGIVIVVAVVIDQIQISMQERIALQRQELK